MSVRNGTKKPRNEFPVNCTGDPAIKIDAKLNSTNYTAFYIDYIVLVAPSFLLKTELTLGINF